jgi:hypothetical protein
LENLDVLDLTTGAINGLDQLRRSNGTEAHINGTMHVNGSASNGHESKGSHFDCIVVEGGMAGLSLAGRLKALGVLAVTNRAQCPGRHELNIPVQLCEASYLQRVRPSTLWTTLSIGRPILSHRQKVSPEASRGTSTSMVSMCGFLPWSSLLHVSNETSMTANLDREGQNLSITAHHIVFAIGSGGQLPKMPEYSHCLEFEGTAMHSVSYKSSGVWKGQKGCRHWCR